VRPLRAACALLLVTVACARATVEGPPKTVLAVFAHPDDEVFVGPLLAHYARQGAKVHLAIVTDGEKGTSPHAGIPAGPELASVRAEVAQEIGKLMARLRPDVVITWGRTEAMDTRITGWWVTSSRRSCRRVRKGRKWNPW